MGNISPRTSDGWESLRQATTARIALGRAGGSLPTQPWLDFKSAHAGARDAVHYQFNAEKLASEIAALGVEVLIAESAVSCRAEYLLRPDLGRRLNDSSRYQFQELPDHTDNDLAIIVSDGLSALAVHRQAKPVLESLLPKFIKAGRRIAPIVVARFGRVALQDEVGQLLRTRAALILIGERPGLGSPDSLGAYLVYGPRIGNTDAQRNCVSNIRPEGMPIEAAVETIDYLVSESLRRSISGVALKDERKLMESIPPQLREKLHLKSDDR